MKKHLLSLLLVITSAIAAMASGHTVTVSNTNVTCNGMSDGTASASVSGGTGPFSYNWTPGGQATAVVTGLTAGTYTVTVTDNSDLSTASASVTITEPSSPLFFIPIFKNNPSCGQSNGSVTFSSMGGQPQAYGGTPPYTYQWSPNVSCPGFIGCQTTALPAGTYYIIATDANGCSISDTTILIDQKILTGVTVTDSIYNETCSGTGDGAIDITLSGSNPGPFTYTWSTGATTQDVANLYSYAYYSLVISDPALNCFYKIYPITVDGINCGTISGTVFSDNDLDCFNDPGDLKINNVIVIANPGNHIAFTNNQGNYIFNAIPYGTYTLTQHINSPYIFPTCTSTANVTLNAVTASVINLDFADTVSSTVKDVMVTCFIDQVVPGYSGKVNIHFSNLTKINATGTMCIGLPPGFTSQITTGNPSGYTINGDSVCWPYTNLPYGTHYYYLDFITPLSVTAGSYIPVCAKAVLNGGDSQPLNNDFCSGRIGSVSCDPNDKSINPPGQGPQGDIALSDNILDYHINFQNIGNGAAFNIVVKDTLSDKLDISTLDLVRSSHDYILDVMPGNILRWKFNNIMLADSFSNEPASHGWISYRIRQNSANQIGEQIKNTAHIYFDFNEAVVTNTTVNTIVLPNSITETASSNNVVKVYPNPFSDNTTFVIHSDKLTETYTFELLDVLGKQVISIKEINSNEFQISRNGLPNGIYFYKIYSAENVVGIGKLVVK